MFKRPAEIDARVQGGPAPDDVELVALGAMMARAARGMGSWTK
jgi:hypothetical protein